MTNLSIPQWTFISKRGAERTENKDYFAVLDSELGTWVIAFDIATSSQATIELAKFFIENIYTQQHKNIDQAGVCKEIIKFAFEATKKKFRVGKASFLAIYRSAVSEKIYGLSAGDCRLGKRQADCIDWLSPVHSGINPLGEFFNFEIRCKEERHILTRSLNLRRDFEPEEFELLFSPNDVLVLATDGFWIELDASQQCSFIDGKVYKPADDTSVLLLTWKERVMKSDFKNNCNDNLFIACDSDKINQV